MLLAGARHAGFQAALFVAMPHKSTAKKYFLCMRKAGPSVAHSSLAGEPALQQQKCVCPLAWPISGLLAVWWGASWSCQIVVMASEHWLCMFCHICRM